VGQAIRVGIVGAGKGGSKIYRKLRKIEFIDISMVCDISDNAPGMIMAEYDGIGRTSSVDELCALDLDIIIETTGLPEVQHQIETLKSPRTSLLTSKGAFLILEASEGKEEIERKRFKGELEVFLNSVQEAIEVAGKDGVIQYVNPSFSRVTGISAQERVGKNIFEVSPDGALARVLRTHEAIYAHRSRIEECNLEIVSNASPIIVEGKITAGFMVFQPLTEAYKILEQLETANQRIAELQDRFNQVTESLYTFDDILGSEPDYERIQNKARRSAKMNTPILIFGEAGTGKDIFAHAIHSASARRDKPFIKVNCADIPESLLESELLGFESYDQVSSNSKRFGKIELANGGTLFFDEIGEMNLNLQTKLLRILNDMEFERIGSSQAIKIDVRVIAATNRNLRELILQGMFLEELYERLSKVELNLPPLRRHKEDILSYAKTFILKCNRKLGKHVVGITTEAEQFLLEYHWPGNIRELKKVIERAMDSIEGDMIHYKHLENLIQTNKEIEEINYREPMALDELEKKMIRLALARYGDSVEGKKRAARVLNISLATLYNKIKTL
jgi:PAS domain S-box-containing protein